jgi:hypothetical protein
MLRSAQSHQWLSARAATPKHLGPLLRWIKHAQQLALSHATHIKTCAY